MAEPVGAENSVPSPISQSLRAAGLRRMNTPSLEAVEKRRVQLWAVMFAILVGLSSSLVVVSFWDAMLPGRLGKIASMGVIRFLFLAVSVAFCVYVLEKERHLRRITRALIDERVLNSALQNRVRELAALSEIGAAINSVQETSEVLDVILGSALDLLGVADGSIMLVDRDRASLRSVCHKSEGEVPTIAAEVVLGEGVPGWVAQHREPLLIARQADRDLFARLVPANSAIQGAMCVPLVHRKELLGVLFVCETSGSRHFNEYDLRVLGLFAENAAVAISNARLFEAERAHVAKLQEVDQHRSEFVATLSHELKSPLTSIIGSARTLRKHGKTLPDEQFGEFLNVIERQSERLIHLIEEILFASRMEAKQLRLSTERIELVSIVEEVMRSFRPRDRLKRLRMAGRPTGALPVLADPNAVQQVLTNLVDNALKYAPGDSPVDVSIAASSNEALITVTDRGPGIPQDELTHIFDRFRQASSSHGSAKGVGLGLYITANLVSSMGGRIWVQSEEAKGASFTFTLPIVQAGAAGEPDRGFGTPVAPPNGAVSPTTDMLGDTSGMARAARPSESPSDRPDAPRLEARVASKATRGA